MIDEFDIEDEGSPLRFGERLDRAERELEASMRFGYAVISDMGIESWIAEVGFSQEKMKRILQNMIKWHSDPVREEYEKCIFLKRGLDMLESNTI